VLSTRLVLAVLGFALAFSVGADVADKDLMAAARAGDASMIKSLVASGVDINARDERGVSPLGTAAFHGHADAVRILLSLGAKQTGSEKEPGFSPLRIAISRNHIGVIRVLLEAGADVNERLSFGATQIGDTALMEAVWWSSHYRDLSAVSLLLQFGADPNGRNAELYDDYEESRGGRDWRGYSVLTFAAKRGMYGVVQLLLQHGADPTLTRTDGKTALILAVENRRPKTAQLLRTRGSSPEPPNSTVEKDARKSGARLSP
jgi:ankyrin repeat protein